MHVVKAGSLEERVRCVGERTANSCHGADGVGAGTQMRDAAQELQSVTFLQKHQQTGACKRVADVQAQCCDKPTRLQELEQEQH